MPLVPKITRLTKLPELLKHKQESEEKARQDREKARKEHQKRYSDIEDEVTLNPESISEFRVHNPKKELEKPKNESPDKGQRVDMQI